MAVITPGTYPRARCATLAEVDVLESGSDRDAVPLPERVRALLAVRPPGWALGGLALVIALALVGGVAAARDLRADQAREALRVDVVLVGGGATSTTVGGVARGQFSLRLSNRRDVPVQVEEVVVEVPGLEVLAVEPGLGEPLGAREEREVVVSFVVADCEELALPGRVSVAMSTLGPAGAGPVVRRHLAVVDPDAEGAPDGQDAGAQAVRIGACPDSARAEPAGRPTDLSVRPAGGSSERSGAGAVGTVLVAVRNGGEPVRLLSVEAQVPGVVFAQRRLAGGRTLVPDEVLVVGLRFRVEDCAALQRTGRLVLRVERSGAVQELGLRVVAEPLAGAGPQADLRVVLDACS